MPPRVSVSGPDFSVLYRGMRVDHLSPGELDYELFLRNVVIADDESRCKRRRRLKQILKNEREGHEFIVHYDQDPEIDLEACRYLFREHERTLSRPSSEQEKKTCKARLLHLGHRLAIVKNHAVGVLKDQASEAFRSVLDLFSEHFWSDDAFFRETGDDSDENDLLDEAAGGTEEPTQPSLQSQTGARSRQSTQAQYVTTEQFNQAMTDVGSLIKALATQIGGLREEIQKLSQPAQSSNLNDTNPFRSRPENPGTARVNGTNFGTDTRPNVAPKVSFKRSTGFPESTTIGAEVLNNSFQQRLDELSFTSSVPGNAPSVSHAAPSRVEFAQPVYQASPQRKVIPVSQWKIRKYSGSDQGLGLNEFLSHIHQLAVSEHASADDLFDSAIHLFDGAALSWYTGRRNQNSLFGWSHLVHELKNEFRHPDLDSLLRSKIYQTRQQKGESFQQYYLQIDKLCQAMNQSMTELEKVEILKANLRYDCRKALIGRNIRTLQDLIKIGKDLDATDFSAFSKVFGPSKRETCAITSGTHVSVGSKTFYSRNKAQDPKNATNHSTKNPNFGSSGQKGQQDKPTNSHFAGKHPEKESNRTSTPKEALAGPSKSSALLKMVSNYSPPSSDECFNCGEEHDLSDCPIPRRVFCDACGFKGFTKKNCPYCLKNQFRKS